MSLRNILSGYFYIKTCTNFRPHRKLHVLWFYTLHVINRRNKPRNKGGKGEEKKEKREASMMDE